MFIDHERTKIMHSVSSAMSIDHERTKIMHSVRSAMFIDHERTKITHSVRSAMFGRSITNALALVIHRHRTPKGVREPLFVGGAIDIALLTECPRSYSA